MGITSFIFPRENSFSQTQHDGLDDDPEISDSLLHAVAFYMKTLAVPAPRNIQAPDVQNGKKIFSDAGCKSCHRPSMRTKVNVALPALSNQRISPYTDLLLHDMGTDLADQRTDFLANGSEWRTPPLWGIGLTRVVNGHTNFLHDGRARNIQEAILWHGGEAAASVQYFYNLSRQDRNDLLKFLSNL